MQNGLGVFEWKDGRVYTGQWKDSEMHGFGRYILKENKTYEGEFYADKKHGYGIYTWPDGRVYEGYWKDSK